MLEAHPRLLVGLTPCFYMMAAVVIEFTLAFALVWTPLARRLGAIVLAVRRGRLRVREDGRIGHLPIMAILLLVAVDDKPAREPLPALTAMTGCAALAAVVATYAAHALIAA